MDAKEEVDRLLAKDDRYYDKRRVCIHSPIYRGSSGTIAVMAIYIIVVGADRYCGQCALPGHAASTSTSTTVKCAACGGKGAHKARDAGCPVYQRELADLRPPPVHSHD